MKLLGKTQEQVDKESYEKAAMAVRQERERLLAECDWTQLPDAPADKALWATYRQELRDITTQAGFPHAVVWPIKPS